MLFLSEQDVVEFSVIQDGRFLVCHSKNGSHRIVFIEEIHTRKRNIVNHSFPSREVQAQALEHIIQNWNTPSK